MEICSFECFLVSVGFYVSRESCLSVDYDILCILTKSRYCYIKFASLSEMGRNFQRDRMMSTSSITK